MMLIKNEITGEDTVINVTDDELMKISQMSFVRMDGAWFMAVAKANGIQAAWEMDVEAWKQFPMSWGRILKSQ